MNVSGQPELAIVTVSYNSAADLPDYLRSLRTDQACHPRTEVIVVDNGSRDGSAAVARELGADLVLQLAGNPGFASACNAGAAASRSPWLLFLNPDCRVGPGDLARLLAHLQANSLAIIGCALRDVDGADQAAAHRTSPTPARAMTHLFARMLGKPARRHSASQGKATSGYAQARSEYQLQTVEAVSGAAMALATDTFKRLGGFDSGYRLHCEDLDFCRRALAAGIRIYVANDVRPVHLKGTASAARPVFVEWHRHRGMWRYFWQHDYQAAPAWQRWLIPPALIGHWVVRSLLSLLGRTRARLNQTAGNGSSARDSQSIR